MWYIYILECEDHRYYVGLTEDVVQRWQEHKSGIGGHFTGYNVCKELVYTEPFGTRMEAEQREIQLKKWSHAKKRALINGDMQDLKALSRSRE